MYQIKFNFIESMNTYLKKNSKSKENKLKLIHLMYAHNNCVQPTTTVAVLLYLRCYIQIMHSLNIIFIITHTS